MGKWHFVRAGRSISFLRFSSLGYVVILELIAQVVPILRGYNLFQLDCGSGSGWISQRFGGRGARLRRDEGIAMS